MKDRTLKNQKKHINKTLKQFRLAKRLIQLSITGTVSVITASLSFYFCPGFSSQVIKDARSAISFVQTASGQKFHELEDFLKKQTQPEPKIQKQTELSEDTSRTQGIPDTSSVTANTSPVILGKAENLHMEAQTGSDGNSYDAAILDTSMGPMYYYNQGDTRWSSYLYGGSDPMQQYGCGPTAAAMLISSFTNDGEAITPGNDRRLVFCQWLLCPPERLLSQSDPICPYCIWLPGGICNRPFAPECSFPSFFRSYPGRPYG